MARPTSTPGTFHFPAHLPIKKIIPTYAADGTEISATITYIIQGKEVEITIPFTWENVTNFQNAGATHVQNHVHQTTATIQ